MKEKILKFENSRYVEAEVEIPEETGINIYVNSRHLATIAVSPDHLEELALGFLFTEAVIDSIEEIRKVEVDSSNNCYVELAGDFSYELARTRVVTSGCGGGEIAVAKLKKLWKLGDDVLTLRPQEITGFVKQSLEEFSKDGKKRGIHHASILSESGSIYAFADIGRHNALDKAVGFLLKKKERARAVFATGRLSSEMVVKCIRLQAGIAISLSSPTSAALNLARNYNLTIVGYARGNSFEIYTHPQRFVGK